MHVCTLNELHNTIFKQGDIFEMQGPLSWATRGLCLVDKEVKWDVLRQLKRTGCLQQFVSGTLSPSQLT